VIVPEPAVLQTRDELWSAIHAERAALADDLAQLDDDRWATPSLCGRWTVEEVVAHLTAAASIGRFRWIRSVVAARFDFDVHNDRRLAEQRGATPAETLTRFRSAVNNTTAASGHTPAWLGEVVVHAQDVRRPLGVERTPSVDALTAGDLLREPRLHRGEQDGRSRSPTPGHGRTVPPRRRPAGPRHDRGPDDGPGRPRGVLRRPRRIGGCHVAASLRTRDD